MKLTDRYSGADDPFRGDVTLWLRGLPAGARVTAATISLGPAGVPEVVLSFAAIPEVGELSAGDWGVTKAPASPGLYAEVDFNTRVTLVDVSGTQSNVGPVTGAAQSGPGLQVDMGGVFVGIADDGTFLAPDKKPWVVNLADSPAALPGLTVDRFRLNAVAVTAAGPGTVSVDSVTVRSVASNVSVRLGQMPPFWTRVGELTTLETSPDFAVVLNAFLDEAVSQNGSLAVPLVIHSDTIARLDAEITVEYVVEQPVLPAQLLEATVPYRFSTLPGAHEALMSVTLPRQAIAISGGANAQVRGRFEPTRVALGPVGEGPATVPVVASPECSLAQIVESDTAIEVTGVDLPLANTKPGLAGLHVSLQTDADGKPSGETRVRADVRVEKPLPGQSSWGSATLPAPIRIVPGARYWLILQSVLGEASWSATSAPDGGPPLQCSRDGGLSWRAASAPAAPAPLAALFRLRDTPDRFTMPVQLQIGRGPDAVIRRLDEFAALGRVEFQFDFSGKLQEYLALQSAASACRGGELLKNGGFDDPRHDDATIRLFGFDVGPLAATTPLEGIVDVSGGADLSVERVLALSVGGQAPVRIDCAGDDPSRTTPEEIAAAIDAATKPNVASIVSVGTTEQFLKIDPGGSSVKLSQWQQVGVPQGWEGEAKGGAMILRARVRNHPQLDRTVSVKVEPLDVVVAGLIGSECDPAILCQRVPVAPECTYVLHFLFAYGQGVLLRHLEIQPMPALTGPVPFWSIRWYDSAGNLIEDHRTEMPETENLRGRSGEVEARLTAPEGAASAELCFVAPPASVLALENVSFAATSEAVENAELRQWKGDVPVGWSRAGGKLVRQGYRTLLRGEGSDDAILSQSFSVTPGEVYEIAVHATSLDPPPADLESRPLEQRARLELRWGTGSGEPVVLFLDGRGFSRKAWSGSAPAGAEAADVRVIQPRDGGTLEIESISVRRTDSVQVPLVFLGEAPGELTVSDLRVAYDLPAPLPSAPEPSTRLKRQPATPVARSVAEGVLALMDVPGVGLARARALTKAGIISVRGLAEASLDDVAAALALPGTRLETAAKMIEDARRLAFVSGRS